MDIKISSKNYNKLIFKIKLKCYENLQRLEKNVFYNIDLQLEINFFQKYLNYIITNNFSSSYMFKKCIRKLILGVLSQKFTN